MCIRVSTTVKEPSCLYLLRSDLSFVVLVSALITQTVAGGKVMESAFQLEICKQH